MRSGTRLGRAYMARSNQRTREAREHGWLGYGIHAIGDRAESAKPQQKTKY